MTADGGQNGESANKPKRVRTGCLTCRERHLKCDEAMPHCNNCKKSSRECKRGIRLNFIDTWEGRPAKMLSLFGTDAWKVKFQDESREIASEYIGGVAKYKHLSRTDAQEIQPQDDTINLDFAQHVPPAPVQQTIPLPPIQAVQEQQHQYHNMSQQQQQQQQQQPAQDMGNLFDAKQPHQQHDSVYQQHAHPPNSGSSTGSQYPVSHANSTAHGSVASYQTADTALQDQDEGKRAYLNNQEETLFMQVFVEEVGLWMDSMDSLKHFSRLLPFHSLSEPMLVNAFLACGARHLTLVNPAYTEEKALHYYDTATRYLLQNLQNPNRDTVICATTAVILNVYEIMSERALQRMNHIAGARALIKECGWNARAVGIGAACFWLNVGLEVLSCLHFNWQCAWDPDDWGLDIDFSREQLNGREEVWTHRMLYIVGKVCNFRATIPRFQEPDQRQEQIRSQHRYEEWCRLKGMCDAWNDGIPRTMHPMAYLYPYQTRSPSVFPEIWLVKRTTIVARLFYHTAMLLLAQINPYYKADSGPMAEQQSQHSQMICGITAHVKDRGVASVAIRSLAHAAEVLTDRREQEEVLQIFDKINKETGWRIGFVYKELKEKWGWTEQPSPEQFAQTHTAARQAKEAERQREQQQRELQQQQAAQSLQLQQGFNFSQQQQQHQQQQQSMQPPPPQQASQPQVALQNPTPPKSGAAAPPTKRPPAGIPNPLYMHADFNLPQHPYQNVYVAPSNNYGHGQSQSQIFAGMY